MAGSTTNIGLIKPTYSEDADVAIINENMDTLDSTISALDNGLAIVSNNNTHGAITAGQYVYVRNHESLAEGMYTANSNIAANATLSSSNLTAVSSGSLNKLNSDITTLNNKSFSRPANDTNFNNITVAGAYCFSWVSSGTTYNRPVNQGGMLLVSIGYNAEVKTQQYTDTNGKVYARGYHDGAWTSWQELALNGLQSGTNNIGGVICAGYNTGSGNYVDFFIPIATNGKTVTSITASSSTSIFLPSKRIDLSSTPTITVQETVKNGIRAEIQYATTQTSNVCATLYLVNVNIVCS